MYMISINRWNVKIYMNFHGWLCEQIQSWQKRVRAKLQKPSIVNVATMTPWAMDNCDFHKLICMIINL